MQYTQLKYLVLCLSEMLVSCVHYYQVFFHFVLKLQRYYNYCQILITLHHRIIISYKH